METGIFEEQDPALRQIDNHLLRFVAQALLRQSYRPSEQRCQVRGDRRHFMLAFDILRLVKGLAVLLRLFTGFFCVLDRIAEVGHEHQAPCPLRKNVVNGR